jgi:hypothetical protein
VIEQTPGTLCCYPVAGVVACSVLGAAQAAPNRGACQHNLVPFSGTLWPHPPTRRATLRLTCACAHLRKTPPHSSYALHVASNAGARADTGRAHAPASQYLVNNAGVYGQRKSFREVTQEDMHLCYQVSGAARATAVTLSAGFSGQAVEHPSPSAASQHRHLPAATYRNNSNS